MCMHIVMENDILISLDPEDIIEIVVTESLMLKKMYIVQYITIIEILY